MKKILFLTFTIAVAMIARAQSVTDIEGNSYKTVKIGKQVWMAQNLITAKFNDGSDIPLVTDDREWRNLTAPGYCWYENNREKNSTSYGALYNWYVVKTGKLCPTGWHVPSDEEWAILTRETGGKSSGGALKEKGSGHWKAPNLGATNETGWTALPSGRRNAGGEFSGLRDWCYFWSATEFNNNKAWYRGIGADDVLIDKYTYNMKSGFSVRCMKD